MRIILLQSKPWKGKLKNDGEYYNLRDIIKAIIIFYPGKINALCNLGGRSSNGSFGPLSNMYIILRIYVIRYRSFWATFKMYRTQAVIIYLDYAKFNLLKAIIIDK